MNTEPRGPWKPIDLGPKGKAGVNGDWRTIGNNTVMVYLHGSDHWYDWMIHLLPWSGYLERKAARQIFEKIETENAQVFVVGGHSAGAAAGAPLANLLDDAGRSVYFRGYGPKRPSRQVNSGVDSVFVRNRKDIVPFLNVFRPRIDMVTQEFDGSFTEAHEPRNYYQAMEEDGFRD